MGDPVRRWAGIAKDAEAHFGIPAAALLGLIKIESGGIEGRTSTANAGGLTQFVPGTAKSYGVNVAPGHARSQIYGAAKYLKALGFNSNPELALKKYNAGPGNPGAAGNYGKNVLAAARGYGSVKGGGGGGGAASGGSSGGGGTTTTTSSTTSGTPDMGQLQSALPLMQALTQGQQAPPSSSIQAPSFTAQAVMPQGFGTVSSGPSVQQGPDIGSLAAAVKTLGGNVPQSQVSQQTLQGVSGGGAGAAGSPSVSTSGYPTGKTGKIIGTPHTGTHTLGNWQSDNAVDISVPKGTAMVALEGGTVVKVKHHPQNGGRFAGDQITIRGADGNSFFYAHGVASVKAGDKVHTGTVLGTTGVANGVPHLHFGVEKGDPRKIIGRGR